MPVTKTDIANRAVRHMQLTGAGQTLTADEQTIMEEGVEDCYYQLQNDFPLQFTLDDVRRDSVLPFSRYVAAVMAKTMGAVNAAELEAEMMGAYRELRRLNRKKPQNHIPVRSKAY